MTKECVACRHHRVVFFDAARRYEDRCLRFSPRVGSIGWSIVRERSPDPEFTDPNRCGPEGKHFAPKEVSP